MDSQTPTGMDDVESQTPRYSPDTRSEDNKKAMKPKAFLVLFVISVALTTCIVVPVMYFSDDPHYSVAIDSASVLNLRTGVSFNLTLGVASRNGAKACINPGMFVQVFYCGIQVAATNSAEARQTCAKPRKTAGLPIVARATMNPVGTVLDSLAAEMGHGAALFDLRLLVPYWRKSTIAYMVFDCKHSRVGDATVPCGFATYTS